MDYSRKKKHWGWVYTFLKQQCSPGYILLTDQMSLSGYLRYFLRYWSICALQLFVNQVVTSSISKLTWSFYSSRFYTWPKKSRQKLKNLENEELLMWNKKHFSSFLKRSQLPKIVSALRVHHKTTNSRT